VAGNISYSKIRLGSISNIGGSGANNGERRKNYLVRIKHLCCNRKYPEPETPVGANRVFRVVFSMMIMMIDVLRQ